MLQRIYFLALPLVCICSVVVDKYKQKAVIVSKYCPSVKGCQDGSHVMCLYYDPNKELGPRCMHVVNPPLTPENAQLIIDICNRIRGKIANGLVKGEAETELPKAYGMTRLSWDPELATLAQVWANQCTMSSDPCRATSVWRAYFDTILIEINPSTRTPFNLKLKLREFQTSPGLRRTTEQTQPAKFTNPGQLLGMLKYTIDDWMPISMTSSHMFNSTTLTPDKVRHAIISILRAWYERKEQVTSDKITYQDVSAHLRNNQFLQLVSSRSTHMGCGFIGYRKYSYNNQIATLLYNTVQIVCNFSYRPNIGEYVYKTTPPTEPGYTLKCGCPLGYDEDEDCLCYETGREMPSTCRETGRCKPAVVVLPIFTVEDAPSNVLKQNYTEVIQITNGPRLASQKRKPFIDFTRTNKNEVQIIKQDSFYKTRRISTDVKNRYFGEKSKNTKNINKLKTKIPHGGHNRRNFHSQSIFAKAAIFQLPSNKIKQVQNVTYKKDVKPRKDFSKIQKLVSKYLEGRRIIRPFQKSKDNHNFTYVKSVTIGPYGSRKAYTKVHNLNGLTKHKFTYKDLNSTRTQSPEDEIKSTYEENDQMFMNLLDKLEEEVNNIDFNTKEKIVFDEKIRKIYGTLVKKSVATERPMGNTNILMNKDIFDTNNIQTNISRRNYWLDPNKPNEYTYPSLEERPINEKSIKKYYDKVDSDSRNKYAKNDDRLSYRRESYYNDNMEERELRNMYPSINSHLISISKGDPRPRNYYLKSDLDEYDSLKSERRRHSYDKLNNLQRKVSMIKKHGPHNFISEDIHLRPVRPSKQGNLRRNRPKEVDLYMPNRARFVHGF